MIKVLQVISGNDYGGGGVHVLNTIKASKNIYNNNLLLIGDGPLVDKCIKEDISFKLVENKVKNSDLVKYINENHFDIVNFHGARSVLIHLINKKKINTTTVVTVHSDFNKDFDNNDGIKKSISTFILKKSLKSFRNHIGVSEFIKDILIENGITRDSYVVSNAIDLEKLIIKESNKEIRNKLNLDNEAYVFSIVARLHPIKNHKKLILAFKKLTEKYKNARLLIIGDGILEEDLKKLVKEQDLEKEISFLGYIDNPCDYVNASNVSMITSFSEGGIPPLAILESLSLGVPCISSELKGLKSILKDNLLYVDANSVESILNAMKEAIENKERMDYIARQGKEIAINEFSLESFANNYLSIYKKLLHR